MTAEQPIKGISRAAAMKLAEMWDSAGRGAKNMHMEATHDGGAAGQFIAATDSAIVVDTSILIDKDGKIVERIGSRGKPGESPEITI